MNPINAKALLDLAVTVIAAITSEVLDKRSAAKRSTATSEDRNDRPS